MLKPSSYRTLALAIAISFPAFCAGDFLRTGDLKRASLLALASLLTIGLAVSIELVSGGPAGRAD